MFQIAVVFLELVKIENLILGASHVYFSCVQTFTDLKLTRHYFFQLFQFSCFQFTYTSVHLEQILYVILGKENNCRFRVVVHITSSQLYRNVEDITALPDTNTVGSTSIQVSTYF